MTIKYLASLITALRIVGAFALLLTTPLSVPFYLIYSLCCVSDIIDGYVARKTKTTSRFGEVLDSVADLILTAILLVIFIPLLTMELWMFYWIGIIAAVRVLSLGIGFAKYHTFASLHTYTNKVTGLVFVCFPVLYQILGLTVTVFVLCGIASLSALEELIITTCSKKLNRNISGIWRLYDK